MGEADATDFVENAWGEALVRATAQTVFDNLTRIANEPKLFRNRWLWELFQNAVDSADSGAVRIKIELSDDFRFSHDGIPFSIEEAVQLILHGSTKRLQSDKIGKFGTGFLATHFLSRHVDVVGKLRGGAIFQFKLERDAVSAHDLEIKMTAAKNQLKAGSEGLSPLGRSAPRGRGWQARPWAVRSVGVVS